MASSGQDQIIIPQSAKLLADLPNTVIGISGSIIDPGGGPTPVQFPDEYFTLSAGTSSAPSGFSVVNLIEYSLTGGENITLVTNNGNYTPFYGIPYPIEELRGKKVRIGYVLFGTQFAVIPCGNLALYDGFTDFSDTVYGAYPIQGYALNENMFPWQNSQSFAVRETEIDAGNLDNYVSNDFVTIMLRMTQGGINVRLRFVQILNSDNSLYFNIPIFSKQVSIELGNFNNQPTYGKFIGAPTVEYIKASAQEELTIEYIKSSQSGDTTIEYNKAAPQP